MLSGFLGAGKTTLLNRLLTESHGERIAVVVNDFGEVSIDQRLVVRRDDTTVALANGCICCTIRDDLLETLRGLLRAEPRPDRIVVEMSGIADPGAVVRTFRLMERRWPLDLDGVVALVDAEQFPVPAEPHYMLAREQLAGADLIVVNKMDVVDEQTLEKLAERLRGYVPHARLAFASHGQVPLEVLLGLHGAAMSPPEPIFALPPAHSFVTVTYRSQEPHSLERLREIVTDLPHTVYRVKGVVCLAEHPDIEAVLQIVGRRARITRAGPWTGAPETLLVVIGSEAMDREAIVAELSRARASASAASRKPWAGAMSLLRRAFALR